MRSSILEQIRSVPDPATRSVARLAGSLKALSRSPLELALAYYAWICHHIAYDVPALRAPTLNRMTAEQVLSSRRAVCAGYAELFKALADAGGLEARVVAGTSRSAALRVLDRRPDAYRHAWNAVQLGGKWQLLDATWGAGYVDEGLEFIRCYSEHYFLTPPGQFIHDHLPDDPRWQLLSPVVTPAEFHGLPLLRPAFFALGCGLGSHFSGSITASATAVLPIETAPDVSLTAQVRTTDGRVLEQCTLVQPEDGLTQARTAFPTSGNYVLRIFGKRRSDPGAYEWVADFQVRASFEGSGHPGYPLLFEGFRQWNASLLSPLTGSPLARVPLRFAVRVPGATDLALVQGEHWEHFHQEADLFTLRTKLEQGEATIFARSRGASSQYDALARYSAVAR